MHKTKKTKTKTNATALRKHPHKVLTLKQLTDVVGGLRAIDDCTGSSSG
jgi:hypothetical protein